MTTRQASPTVRQVQREVLLYWYACRYSRRPPEVNPFDECSTLVMRRVILQLGRAAYDTYLRSQRWRTFRNHMLDAAEGRCERCGIGEADNRLLVLDVHHLTYARLGVERDDDVLVLCRPCHRDADVERRGAA